MPTPSPRLGLLKPSLTDPFVTDDIAENWQRLDDYPGIYICTSTTRPTWGAAQAGMLISEIDTQLNWRWSGSAWLRSAPRGLLTTTGGTPARGQRTTDLSMSGTSFVIVCSITNVVVPAGNRTLMIVASWNLAENSAGAFVAGIFRSATNNTGTKIAEWTLSGDSTSPSAGAHGSGASFVTYEAAGLAAGTYSWSFQIRSSATYGGTSYIRANATTPAEIAIIEL